jgi:hypothetical protein
LIDHPDDQHAGRGPGDDRRSEPAARRPHSSARRMGANNISPKERPCGGWVRART